jgi:acetolactate synthase I/II/III large subunit
VTGDLMPGPAVTGDLTPGPAPAMSPSQRTAAAIVGALAAAGTRLLFGIPGGGPNLDVVGAAAAGGLRFVLAHGETAATIMAATCADLTGAPGAVVVTRGPGLASAVNGIAHAALDRLPVIVIADTVPAQDRDRISHQRLDQAALGRSAAKAAITVSAGEAGQVARHAVALAAARPPGPVVLNVDASQHGARPADGSLPASSTRPPDIAPPDGALLHGTDPRAAIPSDDLAPLAAALRAAWRPVVLLGPGALPYTGAVRAVLVGSGIPALHSYRARGIVPDSSAEAAGLFTGGTMESPLLAAADLIIGLGIDPVELIPAAWTYPAPAVLVTDVPNGSAGYFTGGAELVGPLPAAIAALGAHRGRHSWPHAAGVAAKTAAADGLRRAATAAPGWLTPQDVVATVRAHTPSGTIATVDAGAHMLVAMPLWPVEEPHELLISSGLATMGFALPAAIGAALCTPGQPVIAFTGDGGLGMALMEIETAVRHRLRVIVVVFNDATLSLIKIKQQAAGQGGTGAVGYGPVSFAAVATAMGAAAAAVTDVAELDAALAQALSRAGPTLIDARVDPAAYPAVMDLTRGAAGRRGTLE